MAKKQKTAPTNIAAEQENQIRVLRGLLDEARKETDELERVKKRLANAVEQLQDFRNAHRERETEIESLIKRTTAIANERAHLVIAGTELLRDVRYLFRRCDRIVNGEVNA